jgi:hypothetical protein
MSLFKKIFHYFNWDEKESKEMLVKAIKDAVADDVLTAEEHQELIELKQMLRVSEADFNAFLDAEKPIRLTEKQLTIKQWLQSLPPVWQEIFTRHGLSPYLSDTELKYAYKKLETINIKSDTEIDDIKPIKELPVITGLDIDIVKPISIDPVYDLIQLKFFSLSYLRSGYTSIKNINAIQYAVGIEKLILKYLNIYNLTPVSNLKKLKHLEIVYQGIDNPMDISPLYPLNELETLILEGTPVEHIRPLVNLKKLKLLNIQHTHLKSIEGIENCKSLTHVYIGYNPDITDIQYIADLPYLEHLELSNTGVKDISPVLNAKNLKLLEIINTPIQNLDIITQKTELALLKVDNKVDIKWLNRFKQQVPACEVQII